MQVQRYPRELPPCRCKPSPLEVQGEALGISCVQSPIEVREDNLGLVNRGTCHTRGASVEGQTVILNLVCNKPTHHHSALGSQFDCCRVGVLMPETTMIETLAFWAGTRQCPIPPARGSVSHPRIRQDS